MTVNGNFFKYGWTSGPLVVHRRFGIACCLHVQNLVINQKKKSIYKKQGWTKPITCLTYISVQKIEALFCSLTSTELHCVTFQKAVLQNFPTYFHGFENGILLRRGINCMNLHQNISIPRVPRVPVVLCIREDWTEHPLFWLMSSLVSLLTPRYLVGGREPSSSLYSGAVQFELVAASFSEPETHRTAADPAGTSGRRLLALHNGRRHLVLFD